MISFAARIREVDRVTAHDLEILLIVGSGGREIGELRDRLQAARAFQRAVAVETVGKRDEIDCLSPHIDLLHGGENEAVPLLVKFLFAERLQKLGLHAFVK